MQYLRYTLTPNFTGVIYNFLILKESMCQKILALKHPVAEQYTLIHRCHNVIDLHSLTTTITIPKTPHINLSCFCLHPQLHQRALHYPFPFRNSLSPRNHVSRPQTRSEYTNVLSSGETVQFDLPYFSSFFYMCY